ncbi:MAG: LCP family protein, partial [Spirochaetales bacterium]|nr:LCP family protein [Spirochaetales bacterium]
HADGINEKITLIAIPRDLYYQENKINDYYRTFGGEKFIEVLSEITGLRIDGYIAVDMYAFIDLINILGGIDITLESDLIDPTYMVRDNGEWSTLYYTKGTHHLNGIESLRIARSRHTSSDFGRTTRQQLVIQGIKDKMSLLDITDLGTILELFRTLEKYLDTNFSSMEMLSLFTKYKDSNLNRKQGLSTFNVLYNTYTNIYKLEDKSKQYEEDFYRGYWILLPRKNDWNVIKWYIRSLIEGTEI